jgi:hypothetical protein
MVTVRKWNLDDEVKSNSWLHVWEVWQDRGESQKRNPYIREEWNIDKFID